MAELDLTTEPAVTPTVAPGVATVPFNPDEDRERTRGDLARGLLWLLTFCVGGILIFVGLGRLEGTVITQSVFPSLIALAGTALGFYFGSGQVPTVKALPLQSGPPQTGPLAPAPVPPAPVPVIPAPAPDDHAPDPPAPVESDPA